VDTHDESDLIANIPDLYDKVYRNVPSSTHMLKPVENCNHCNAKNLEFDVVGKAGAFTHKQ
jgi:hypothetical protein